MTHRPITADERSIAHLTAAHWQVADAALVAKMLSEFSHEGLLAPTPTQDGRYRLASDDTRVVYHFAARRFALSHWHIPPAAIEKTCDDAPAALDASAFIVEMREQLGVADDVLSLYLTEIAATRYSAAYKRANARLAASAFPTAGFQAIEAAMTEGHPAFVANNGRIGFSGSDFAAFAPEAAAPVRLVWVAAHRSRLTMATAADRSFATHLENELDACTRERFDNQLYQQGLLPADYSYMPVHPWQWQHCIVFAFADEIAARYLVHLGFAPNAYQAQQSVRTLFNHDVPTRCYVKTSLSILNMGFSRGLSPYYMQATPAICDWVDERISGDTYLRRCGFTILREVAAVGYRHPHYDAALPAGDSANKMLAALWRESPMDRVAPEESLMTMAALLHRDPQGHAVLTALIEAAGVSVDAWLDDWLDAYMAPLLHCFYAYDLVFMPHGENIILVLRDHRVQRVIMKDIAEEIAVMTDASSDTASLGLSPDVARVATPVAHDLRTLSIFTDLFDLIFRYIAPVLAIDCDYPEEAFWARVAACITRYQNAHPALANKFVRYDLFAPDFRRSCLNRLQLANNRQMLNLADPTGGLQFAGRLDNPIARHAVERSLSATGTAGA